MKIAVATFVAWIVLGPRAFAASNPNPEGGNPGAGHTVVVSQIRGGFTFTLQSGLNVSSIDFSLLQMSPLIVGSGQTSGLAGGPQSQAVSEAAVLFQPQVAEAAQPTTLALPGVIPYGQERFVTPALNPRQPEDDSGISRDLRETMAHVEEAVQGVTYARESGSLGEVAHSGVALEQVVRGEKGRVIGVRMDPDVIMVKPTGQQYLLVPAQDLSHAPPGDVLRLLDYFLNLPLGQTPQPPAVDHPMAAALLPVLTQTAQRRSEEHAQGMARREGNQQALLSLMAHELRNPLAPLMNGLQLLEMVLGRAGLAHETYQKVKGVLEIMGRQTAQMRRLIDTTLKLTRLSAGKYRPDLQAVNMEQMIRHFMQIHTQLGQDVHLDVDPRLTSTNVQADPDTLEMVVSNLFSNAIKYGEGRTNREGHAVVIHISPDPERSGHIRISFQDFGRGIPQEELAHISEYLFRASTSEGIQGTGLGLNTTASILEAHGSRLIVESDGPGRGSRVSFPLAAVP